MRHGLAGKADPQAWPDDDERPLTGKGRKAFLAAAKGMKHNTPKPALILTSPALRTRETAALLAKAMGLKSGAIRIWDALHYACAPEKAVAELGRQGLPAAAALIGHEPWLGEFLSLLIAGHPDSGLEFSKGGAARVTIPDGGTRAKGRGSLVWLMTQDQSIALA